MGTKYVAGSPSKWPVVTLFNVYDSDKIFNCCNYLGTRAKQTLMQKGSSGSMMRMRRLSNVFVAVMLFLDRPSNLNLFHFYFHCDRRDVR